MKDLMNKAFSLGLGLAQTTKEQAEKLAQELNTRGEMSKSDAQSFVSELIKRGQETRLGIESSIQERVKQTAVDLKLATRDDIHRLEQRISRLEAQLGLASGQVLSQEKGGSSAVAPDVYALVEGSENGFNEHGDLAVDVSNKTDPESKPGNDTSGHL